MNPDDINRLLPQVFQRTMRQDSVLSGLLDVMASQHLPAEKVLSDLQRFFNPYQMPDAFVPYIACWVDLDRFFPFFSSQPEEVQRVSDPISPGIGRLRELIAAAAKLSQWRGTAKGLKLFLEIATGIQGFDLIENIEDKKGVPRPFHIRVEAPAEALGHKALIERIVTQEKPAYVSYELIFAPANEKGRQV